MTDDDDLLGDAPKASTSKVVLALLALNLVVSGFAAFKVTTMPSAAAATSVEEGAASQAAGPIFAFEPFIVNLNDINDPRFLKIRIDVEVADDDVIKALDENKVRIVRDPIMRYLSSLKLSDVMGEKAKTDIAEQIIKRLGDELGADKVRRVLFSEFVVQ